MALTAALLPAPAQAADGWIKLDTQGRDHTRGYAQGDTYVTFNGAKSFNLNGTVADICNGDPDGDGRGAYLCLVVGFAGGDKNAAFFRKDTDGCNNGGTAFNVTKTYTRRVDYVITELYEGNDTNDDGNPEILDSMVQGWRYNQFV